MLPISQRAIQRPLALPGRLPVALLGLCLVSTAGAQLDPDRPGDPNPIRPAERKTQFFSHHAIITTPIPPNSGHEAASPMYTDYTRNSNATRLERAAIFTPGGRFSSWLSGRLANGRILNQETDQAAAVEVASFNESTGQMSLDLAVLAPTDGNPVANASRTISSAFDPRSLYRNPLGQFPMTEIGSVSNGFSYGVTVGELTDAVDDDDLGHEEVAVCHLAGTSANTTVKLTVFDYTRFPDEQIVLETSAMAAKGINSSLYSIPEPNWYPSNSLVSCGAGDLNGDGLDEVAVAYQTDSRNLRVSIFAYVLDGQGVPSLTEISNVDLTVADWYRTPSVDVTFGDMNDDGREELAVASVLSRHVDGTEKDMEMTPAVHLFSGDDLLNLTFETSYVHPDETVITFCDFGTTCAAINVRLFGGLFKFRPSTVDPELNFSFTRRQLALVFDQPGNPGLRALTLGSTRNLKSLSRFGDVLTVNPSGADRTRWWAAAGGFIGVGNEANPLTSLILSTWDDEISGKGLYQIYWVQAIPINSSLEPGGLELVFTHRPTGFQREPKGGQWAQLPIVAWDREDESIYLGSPVHFIVSDLISTDYIIYEPPKHMRWIPDPDDPTEGQIENVSRNKETFIRLKQEETEQYDFEKSNSSDWNAGGSSSVSAAATVGAKGKIGFASVKLEASIKGKVSASYDYESKESSYDSSYAENSVEMSQSTTVDDLIIADVRVMDVWRYPMSGTPLADGLNAFYDIAFPAVEGDPPPSNGVIKEIRSGIGVDWYQPPHENGNALSYPPITSSFYTPPDCCGSYSYIDDTGKEVSTSVVFFNGTLADVNGNNKSLKMTFSTASGSGKTKSYSNNIKSSLDVSLGFKGEATIFGATVKEEKEITFNAHGGTSWGQMETGNNRTSTSTGIEMGIATGNTSRLYQAAPVFYLAEDGTTKAAHGVNLLLENVPYWRSVYGAAPDPALNMPSRFMRVDLPSEKAEWLPNDTSQYNKIRGFFLTSPETDPVTDEHFVLAEDVDGGEELRIVVRVHNYSFIGFAGLEVKFEAVAYDWISDTDVGPTVTLDCTAGSRTILTIDPQTWDEAICVFDTTPFTPETPGALEDYRVYVTLDPDDRLPEIYEGTVGPGQNNYGWGTFTIAHPEDTFMLPTSTATVPNGADISLLEDGIAIEVNGVLETGLVRVVEDQVVPIRVCAATDQTQTGYHHVYVWELDLFTNEQTLIGDKLMHGVDVDGDSCVWIRDYMPRSEGAKVIRAEVLESHKDPVPGNAQDRLELAVDPMPVLLPRQATGSARQVGTDRDDGKLRLVGNLWTEEPLDLSKSSLVLTRALYEEGGAGELLPGVTSEEGQSLVLTAVGDPTRRRAEFKTGQGIKPEVRVVIRSGIHGGGHVRLFVEEAGIESPENCGHRTRLQTEMFLVGSTAPPTEIAFDAEWTCRKNHSGEVHRLVLGPR